MIKNKIVINTKPKFGKIQPTTGIFQTTTTTYNDTSVTYSSTSQVYGGFAGETGPKPQNYKVINL